MTDPHSSPSKSEVSTDAMTLIAQVLQMDPTTLSEEDGMDTVPQWDSLKVIMLASMIEINLGITLESSEIEQLTTVRAVSQVLAHYGQRR